MHTHARPNRDIKPQNLLLDPETHVLKLCDFGSAKFLGACPTAEVLACDPQTHSFPPTPTHNPTQ